MKNKLFLALLTLSSFIVSFFNSTSFHGDEDFIHGIEAFRFLNNPSIDNLMYEGKNSVDFITLPFYLIIGTNLFTLRLVQSIFLTLSILFFFLFCKNFFEDRFKAGLASLLLLSIPFYILTKYHPEFPFLGFFATFLLFLLSLIPKSKRTFLLFSLLGLILGLASYRKIIFLPYGLLVIFTFFFIKRESLRDKIKEWKNIIPFIVFFLIFFSPSIIWNHTKQTAAEPSLLRLLTDTASSLPDAILFRIDHLKNIFFSHGGMPSGGSLALSMINHLVLAISLIFLFLKKNRTALFFLIIVFYTFISVIGIGTYETIHLYLLVPIFPIIIIEGLDEVGKTIKIKKDRRQILMTVVVFLLVLINGYNYYKITTNTNELSSHQTKYEIGYSLKNQDIESIYDFTFDSADSYPFWYNHIYLTSGADKEYINVYKVLLSESKNQQKSIYHKINSNRSSYSVEGIMEDARERKDILFLYSSINDEHLIEEDKRNQLKMVEAKMNEISQALKNYNHKRIIIPEIKNGSHLADYHLWVHESKEGLIQDLQKLKAQIKSKKSI